VKRQWLKKTYGATLIEVLIVILVIAILVALALPNFKKSREYAFNKEAKANLKLIQAAERIYYIENAFFMPPGEDQASNSTTINTYLKLTLPSGSDTSNVWNYTTTSQGTANATRSGSDERVWTLQKDQGDPLCSCPPEASECYCPAD